MIDLNDCKPGDKLKTKHGKIVTYIRKVEGAHYPHDVEYDNGATGSRTDDGHVFHHHRLSEDEDIIEIIKTPAKVKIKNQFRAGQKVKIINVFGFSGMTGKVVQVLNKSVQYPSGYGNRAYLVKLDKNVNLLGTFESFFPFMNISLEKV